MAANGNGMIQSGIFEDLQRKIDEDTQIKDVRMTSPEAQWEAKFLTFKTDATRYCADAGEARYALDRSNDTHRKTI